MARNKSVKEKVQENTDRIMMAVFGNGGTRSGNPRAVRYLATTMTPAQIRALESVLGPLPVDRQPTE